MDVKDCYAALQEAVSAGLVDPERVVVQGGSHGGMVSRSSSFGASLVQYHVELAKRSR